ncbi:hypothetical protein D3C74_296950 [compost metagenome]
MKTVFRSTKLKERLITTKIVRFLLRPRLERAMRWIFAPPVDFFSLPLFLFAPLVYLTASIGDTDDATLPGLKVLIITVMSANKADPIKIHGLGDTDITVPLKLLIFIIKGTSDLPIKKPAINPIGIPRTDRISACLRMILRICLLLVPIVFKRP